MSRREAVSKLGTLQESVTVKKVRFKLSEIHPKPPSDVRQRRANFEEFKAVYGDQIGIRPSKNRICPVHKAKSESLYSFPQTNSEPHFVETINIELPFHLGADRAVQLIENKIKPKRSTPKVHREVITKKVIGKLPKIDEVEETQKSVISIPRRSLDATHISIDSIQKSYDAFPKPDVVIQESTDSIQKRSEATIQKELDAIQKQMDARKEVLWKGHSKLPVTKPRKKLPTKDKIMAELTNISEKLEKMHQKYYDQPRVQYKSVNDCFTQSGNVEVIYENQKYPEDVKVGNDVQQVSGDTIDSLKLQESLKELNRIFPEFPKIEDTLKEIENHLDSIVNLEANSVTIQKAASPKCEEHCDDGLSMWDGTNLASVLEALEKQYSPLDRTNKILKELDEARDKKLNSIRQQIEVVEEFCDRMSEIANDESESDTESLSYHDRRSNGRGESKKLKNCSVEDKERDKVGPQLRHTEVTSEFREGLDMQASIKKSNYLSKEFGNLEGYPFPQIKVFSDNDQRILWRKQMMSIEQTNKRGLKKVDSVTKLVDSLKHNLDNSVYELVT